MKTINLIFGCHSHQPVGNFGFVFEQAYEKAYLPFVEVLEKYPAVKVCLHFTGPLWDWFAEHEPGYIERLAGLVKKGQVSIMGGGYYEPLLCAIPERDAIAQIKRMQDFAKEHFGEAPRGMWLTERVWEPQMARTLAKAGVEYTALDDSHFFASGLRRDEVFGYYMTEDEGRSVKVFPILEKLRYLIPFHQVHETIDYLREVATEDGLRCAVVHDDGEKFGIWPGTHSSVYGEGWLEEFFAALTENKDWIRCLSYEQYMEKAKARGRVYVTCSSYHEMGAWALPTHMQRDLHALESEFKSNPERNERFGTFIRGSFWRGFLGKYPEANNMQKRMLRVSERLARLKRVDGDTPQLAAVEKLLHQAQCNCAYWHGVFGGLYLNHLRSAIYEKLVEASRELDKIEARPADFVSVEMADFDGDGNDEAILDNAALSLFVSPADGGTLFELDYKPIPFNVCNTLSRREEVYHDDLRSGRVVVGEETSGVSIHDMVRAKEADLDRFLVYDPYRRVCLRDHFFPKSLDTSALWGCAQEEWGDFASAHYEVSHGDDWVKLSHEGLGGPEPGQRIRLSKAIELGRGASSFKIRYHIENVGDRPVDALFGVEFAANYLTGDAPDRYYRSNDRDLGGTVLGEMGLDADLRHIALRDDWRQVEVGLRFSAPAQVHRFPIETVSQSEGGQERVHQGNVVLPCWPVACEAGGSRSITLDVEVHKTKDGAS